jgi:hypothetical protein
MPPPTFVEEGIAEFYLPSMYTCLSFGTVMGVRAYPLM